MQTTVETGRRSGTNETINRSYSLKDEQQTLWWVVATGIRRIVEYAL